jgi:5-methylcytosine-specific restriction endonuclease McrA
MTTCTIEGCSRDVRPGGGRGWCRLHYDRWYRNGSPDIRTQKRLPCEICQAEFEPRNNARQAVYEDCRSDNDKMRAWRTAKQRGRVSLEICAIEGCCRVARSRGWCVTHYGRWLKNGSPHIATQNRRNCEICRAEFPLRNGRQAVCDDCRADDSKMHAWSSAKKRDRARMKSHNTMQPRLRCCGICQADYVPRGRQEVCDDCRADDNKMRAWRAAKRANRINTAICAIEGCSREVGGHGGRGWCPLHYHRWRKNGSPHTATQNRFHCEICHSQFVPRNGRQLVCDDCRADRDKISAWRNAKTMARYDLDREAYKRKRREYPQKYADKIKKYQREWYDRNRAHIYAYAREYAQRNKEQRQAWMDANRAEVRQWVQRRRARLRENGVYEVTAKDLDFLLRTHNFACAYCGTSLDTSTVTWDHIMPISRGGQHSVGNLAPACLSCNSGKCDRTSREWLALLKKVRSDRA